MVDDGTEGEPDVGRRPEPGGEGGTDVSCNAEREDQAKGGSKVTVEEWSWAEEPPPLEKNMSLRFKPILVSSASGAYKTSELSAARVHLENHRSARTPRVLTVLPSQGGCGCGAST